MKYYLLVVLAINATIADANPHLIECDITKLSHESLIAKYTQQKKLRKSQKTMQHKNTKVNNYSIFIYLFRYMSSVEKNIFLSLLAPIPLLWYSVKQPRGQSHFSQK